MSPRPKATAARRTSPSPSRSAAASANVTVDYATANGTASAGSDYTATSGTLTFTPGQTSKTITVMVNGDTTVEPDETFIVNLTNASANATITTSQRHRHDQQRRLGRPAHDLHRQRLADRRQQRHDEVQLHRHAPRRFGHAGHRQLRHRQRHRSLHQRLPIGQRHVDLRRRAKPARRSPSRSTATPPSNPTKPSPSISPTPAQRHDCHRPRHRHDPQRRQRRRRPGITINDVARPRATAARRRLTSPSRSPPQPRLR